MTSIQVTDKKAREMLCPFVVMSERVENSGFVNESNRQTFCCGSGCMAWTWPRELPTLHNTQDEGEPKVVPIVESKGYCGRVGKVAE